MQIKLAELQTWTILKPLSKKEAALIYTVPDAIKPQVLSELTQAYQHETMPPTKRIIRQIIQQIKTDGSVNSLFDMDTFEHYTSFKESDLIPYNPPTTANLKKADQEISLEQQVQSFKDRMSAVTERLANPPAKTADLETTQDLSNVEVKDLSKAILHLIDMIESKVGENVSADPEIHPMLEELENKVWEIEQKLGIKPEIPEHEKAEPEHKEIVEEVEKESAIEVKADDVNTPPTSPAPVGMKWAWEPKTLSWILVATGNII